MKVKNIDFHYESKKKALSIGILAIYLNFFFTFLGMNEVKGIDNAFMNALAPILTFLISLFLLKKKGNWHDYLAVFLTFFAFLLSIHFRIFDVQLGFWYLLLGLFLYTLGNVLMQKWNLHQSLVLSFYELLFGFLLLCIHCLVKGQFNLTLFLQLTLWQWILLIVISGIGFAYIQVVYMKAIDQIGAFETSFFLSINPIVTYIESLLFLNETFDMIHFISFIVLGIAVFLIKKKGTSS